METTDLTKITLYGVEVSYIENLIIGPLYYSLSQADFTPSNGTIDYTNSGAQLTTTSATSKDFQAGINLPNGARIDWLDFYYRGVTGKVITARLAFTDATAVYNTLGSVDSVALDGNNSGYIDSFSSRKVDNEHKIYWMLERILNGPKAYGVRIQYTPRIYSDDETWFSVAAAAFVPDQGNHAYRNSGNRFQHTSESGSLSRNYIAAIPLAQGVSITRMGFVSGGETTSETVNLMLFQAIMGIGTNSMWHMNSSAPIYGFALISSPSIQYNPIDLRKYKYYLLVDLPESTDIDWVSMVGVIGQWTYKLFLPVGRR